MPELQPKAQADERKGKRGSVHRKSISDLGSNKHNTNNNCELMVASGRTVDHSMGCDQHPHRCRCPSRAFSRVGNARRPLFPNSRVIVHHLRVRARRRTPNQVLHNLRARHTLLALQTLNGSHISPHRRPRRRRIRRQQPFCLTSLGGDALLFISPPMPIHITSTSIICRNTSLNHRMPRLSKTPFQQVGIVFRLCPL